MPDDAVRPEALDHVAVAVESLEDARPFWVDALGGEVLAEEEVPTEKVRVLKVRVGGQTIELLEPVGDDSPVRRFLDRRGPGIHHLCLRVPDVAGASEALSEGGWTMIYDDPRPGAGGCSINFVHPKASGGVLLELSQPGEAERG